MFSPRIPTATPDPTSNLTPRTRLPQQLEERPTVLGVSSAAAEVSPKAGTAGVDARASAPASTDAGIVHPIDEEEENMDAAVPPAYDDDLGLAAATTATPVADTAATAVNATASTSTAATDTAAAPAAAPAAADRPIGKTTGVMPSPAQDFRDAIKNLMESVKTAKNSVATEAACETFRETEFGKKVKKDLHVHGIVNVPYGASEEDALRMAGVVCGAAQNLVLGDKPHKERVNIKGQTRYGLDASHMGSGTISAFACIAEGLAAVLCAVVDGASAGVVTHKHAALANAIGTELQIWHRDTQAEKVLAKTDPSHEVKRTRVEPHPFSAVTAFEENTVLHVVKGSHARGEEYDFSEDISHTHHIPIGYSAVFYSILVHRGMGTDRDSPRGNIRGHMYLTAQGCMFPEFGKIEVIQGPKVVSTATDSTPAPAATTFAVATTFTPLAVATPPTDDTSTTAAATAAATVETAQAAAVAPAAVAATATAAAVSSTTSPSGEAQFLLFVAGLETETRKSFAEGGGKE